MINYELPTGLSQNLISLLLPMSELPKRLNEPERASERERENHTRHFFPLFYMSFTHSVVQADRDCFYFILFFIVARHQ